MRALFFSLLLLIACTPANGADPADPMGWQTLRWGMTKEEAVSAMPALRQYETSRDGKKDTKFGIQYYKIFNCNVSVEPTFKENRLSRIVLYLDNAEHTHCPFLIENRLREKYQSPYGPSRSYSTTSTPSFTIEWLFPTTRIILSEIRFLAMNRVIFSVSYSEREETDRDRM